MLCFSYPDLWWCCLLKILIAVSSQQLAELLASSLTQHHVHICHTGWDTLQQLDCLRPDALLLDLALPDTDGITLLGSSRYKPPIILALTNLVTPGILTEAAAVGVQDLLLLPCSLRQIRKHLDVLTEKALSPEG